MLIYARQLIDWSWYSCNTIKKFTYFATHPDKKQGPGVLRLALVRKFENLRKDLYHICKRQFVRSSFGQKHLQALLRSFENQ